MPDLILTKRRDWAYITGCNSKGDEFLQTHMQPVEGVFKIHVDLVEEYKKQVETAYNLLVDIL